MSNELLQNNNKYSFFNRSLWIICGILCFTVILTWLYLRHVSVDHHKRLENDTQQKTILIANKLSQELYVLTQTLQKEIIDKIESGNLDSGHLPSVIKHLLQHNKQLFAIGVNYLPYTKPEDLRQGNAFYLNQSNTYPPNADLYVQMKNVLIYNSNTVKHKNHTDRVAIGFMYVDFDLAYFEKAIALLNLGQAGYVYFIKKNGQFLYHPDKSLMANQKTLFDAAEDSKNTDLFVVATKITQGISGNANIIDHVTGRPARMFYQNLPMQGWAMCTVLFDDYQDRHSEIKAHTLHFCLLIEIICLLLALITVMISPFRNNKELNKTWWGFVVTAVFVSGVVTIWIWQFTIESTFLQRDDGAVLDVLAVSDATAKFTKALQRTNKTIPVTILTGVQIQAITFLSHKEVQIAGYIWQRAPIKSIASDFMGVQFLPIYDLDKTTFIKIHDTNDASMRTIVWSFAYLSHQKYNLFKYPLYSRKIVLDLLPVQLEKNIILTPDLDSYFFIHPRSLPGAKEFYTASWKQKSSFFNYSSLSNNQTMLNINHYIKNYPRLQFNIYMQYVFLQALFCSVIPVSVILLILISLLLTMTHVSLFSFLSACSAGIFTTAILHSQFRTNIAYSEVVYLDYFFILLYCSIMVLIIEAVFYRIFKKTSGFYQHDNSLTKMLFLPVFMCILFVITLWVFY